VFKILGIAYFSDRKKANTYVREVLMHVEKIVRSEDLNDKEIDYSHEVVKRLYENASQSVGEIVKAENVAKILQALAAARIYYWVRHYSA